MPGIGTIIGNLRREFVQSSAATSKRFEELLGRFDQQSERIDALEKRLSEIDTAAAPPKPGKSGGKVRSNPDVVPIPERPESMKQAGVGADPR